MPDGVIFRRLTEKVFDGPEKALLCCTGMRRQAVQDDSKRMYMHEYVENWFSMQESR